MRAHASHARWCVSLESYAPSTGPKETLETLVAAAEDGTISASVPDLISRPTGTSRMRMSWEGQLGGNDTISTVEYMETAGCGKRGGWRLDLLLWFCGKGRATGTRVLGGPGSRVDIPPDSRTKRKGKLADPPRGVRRVSRESTLVNRPSRRTGFGITRVSCRLICHVAHNCEAAYTLESPPASKYHIRSMHRRGGTGRWDRQ